MSNGKQSRRARLRSETSAEIKAIAVAHMAAAGPASISLRAIAREMGMTAGAIYSYFSSRDDLISALSVDVYDSLAVKLEASQRPDFADSAYEKLLSHARAYRQWAISHPDEFDLLYGDPIPDYERPEEGSAQEAEYRLCATLLEVMAAAWPQVVSTLPPESAYQWSDFRPGLVAMAQESFPELPPAAAALCLRVWSRMHGLLSLEIYGHLRNHIGDPGKLYEADMLELARSLGLTARMSANAPGGAT